MKLKPTIALSAAGLLFHPATGDSFASQPGPVPVQELLQEKPATPAAEAALLARYEVEAQQLDQQWNALVAEMHGRYRLG